MKYIGFILLFIYLSSNAVEGSSCKNEKLCECSSKPKYTCRIQPAVKRCGCETNVPTLPPVLPPAPLANFGKSVSDFGINLYREISKITDAGNDIIISPFSCHSILSLVMQGAMGPTLVELMTGLKFDGSVDQVARSYYDYLSTIQQNSLVKIANKAYFQQGYQLNPAFSTVATRDFYSSAEIINFSNNVVASNTINQWVESQTNNLIKNLISPQSLNSLTRAVLVNTIYFKGTWTKQFATYSTYPEPFYSSRLSEPVDIDLMHKTDTYNYVELPSLDAKAIQLTYKSSNISMVFLLPNALDGIRTLETKLQNFNLQTISQQLKSERVVLSLPKFKSSYSVTLNGPLSNLGMPTMFTDAANFDGLLTNNEPLKITSVVQKAFIAVTEEGTEAAAATGVVVGTTSMPYYPEPPKVFKADHPFIYCIQDGAGSPYFIGRFENNSSA